MATIAKRNGRYAVSIRKKGFPTQCKTFLKHKDAEAWALKVEADMQRGAFVDDKAQRTTLADALKDYREKVIPHKRSVEQLTHRTDLLEKHLGKLALSDLDSQRISEYRDMRLETVQAGTVIQELGVLSRVLDCCQKDWGIQLPKGNPMKHVRRPKSPRGRDRRVSTGELQAILAQFTRNPEIRTLTALAVETAMRRSELVRIEWQHIDFDGKTLHIPETKTKPRTIPLTPIAVDLLESCKPVPEQEQEQGNVIPLLRGPLFSLEPRSLSQAFRRGLYRARAKYEKDCGKAGIDPDPSHLIDIHFHDLRHEGTSRFFELGLQMMEVATITGHEDLAMLKRYTHIKPEHLADRLSAIYKAK